MRQNKKIVFLAIIIFVLGAILFMQNMAWAGSMTAIMITLQEADNNNISAVSMAVDTMKIAFDPVIAINANDGILISFANDFDISDVINSDVTINQANSSTDIIKGVAIVNGQNLRIPIVTESDAPIGTVTVTITGSHIITPTTSGTYTITVTTWNLGVDGVFGGSGDKADTLKDTGTAAIVIGTNHVNISDTIDPTLTMVLSANICDLVDLSITNIKTCSYDVTVSTNGNSGYNAYIKAGGNLRNSATSIANVSDGEIKPASEGYGVSTTDGNQTVIQINDANNDNLYNSADCTFLNDQGTIAMNATPLTTSDKIFAYSFGPISGSTSTLCHAVGIASTTPAGPYSQSVTITVVAGF